MKGPEKGGKEGQKEGEESPHDRERLRQAAQDAAFRGQAEPRAPYTQEDARASASAQGQSRTP